MVVPVLVFSLMFIVHMGVSLSGAVLVHQAANAAARCAAESVRASADASTLISAVKTTANTVLAAGGISEDSSGPGAWCDANLQVVVQERVSDAPTWVGTSAISGFAFISSCRPHQRSLQRQFAWLSWYVNRRWYLICFRVLVFR